MGSNGPPPKRESPKENNFPTSPPPPLTNGQRCGKINNVKQSPTDCLEALLTIDYFYDKQNEPKN